MYSIAYPEFVDIILRSPVYTFAESVVLLFFQPCTNGMCFVVIKLDFKKLIRTIQLALSIVLMKTVMMLQLLRIISDFHQHVCSLVVFQMA